MFAFCLRLKQDFCGSVVTADASQQGASAEGHSTDTTESGSVTEEKDLFIEAIKIRVI